MSERTPSEKIIETLNSTVAFNKKAGTEVLEIGPGVVRGRLRDLTDNTNHNGDIAAGGIFTLGELMPGALLSAELADLEIFLVVRRVEIDFTSAGRGELRAECRLDDESRRLLDDFRSGRLRKFECTLPVVVEDARGKEVARLRGTYYIRRMTAALKRKSPPYDGPAD